MAVALVVLIAMAGAILPTAVYIALVWWLDRYEKEPLLLLAAAFLWGAVPAVVAAAVPEVIFDELLNAVLVDSVLIEGLSSGFAPPLIEESVKGIFLVGLLLLFWKHFDSPLDGIVYGSMVGFGFAMTENLFYILGVYSEEGIAAALFTMFLRTVVFGLNHAFFTSWIGLALGWARLNPGFFNRLVVPVLGWLAAMFFHSVHNLGAAFAEATVCLSVAVAFVSDWGGILLMLVIAFGLIGRERQWLVAELQPEVASGVLSQQEFEVLTSSRRRARVRMQALMRQGWQAYRRLGQFFAAATDLAFTKHQLHKLGEEGGNSAEIAQLRSRVQVLRQT